MGDVNHARVLIRGAYTDAYLSEETWQIGVNFGLEIGSLADVAVSSYAFDAAEADLTESDSTWDIESNFLFEGGATDIDPADWLLSEIGPAVKTFIETASILSNIVEVSELVVYPIGADGKVIQTDYGVSKAVATPKVEINGAYTGGVVPLQIATVVSFDTLNNSRGGKGRVYLPTTSVSAMIARGSFNPTYTSNVANAAKALLNSMTLVPGDAEAAPVVCPSVAGKLNRIQSVRVGTIPDTQRRRRRQLVEDYTTVSL